MLVEYVKLLNNLKKLFKIPPTIDSITIKCMYAKKVKIRYVSATHKYVNIPLHTL